MNVGLAMIAYLVMFATASLAATITLHDGRTFRGTIVEKDDTSVVLRADLDGIAATLTIDRDRIASMTDAGAGAVDAGVAVGDRLPWMLLRVGSVGLDFSGEAAEASSLTASGLDRVLRRAERSRVEHVVLRIDSRSGVSEAGRAVAGVIADYPTITVHAIVVEAVGPAAWLVVAADHVWVGDSGEGGGVIAFGERRGDDSYATGAIVSTEDSARLSSIAADSGFPQPVVRAMTEPAELLFSWLDDAGDRVFSNAPPVEMARELRILDDSHGAPLVLGVAELVELGIARGELDDPAGLGEAAGLEGWAARGFDATTWVIQENRPLIEADRDAADAYAEVDRLARVARELPARLRRRTVEARRIDPENFSYGYNTETGRFTPESRRLWRERTDRAVRAWREIASDLSALDDAIGDVRDEIRRAERLEHYEFERSRHERLIEASRGMLEFMRGVRDELETLADETNRTIDRLRDERDRSGV